MRQIKQMKVTTASGRDIQRCPYCHKFYAVHTPKYGDGSAGLLRAHSHNSNPCLGSYRLVIYVIDKETNDEHFQSTPQSSGNCDNIDHSF
jgi:uncharacterized C2H2 Zn-finger protein